MRCLVAGLLLWLTAPPPRGWAAALPVFPDPAPAGPPVWTQPHDCEIQAVSGGVLLRLTGPDPHLSGPAQDFPPGVPLWLELEIHSEVGGPGQVFWYRQGGPSEEASTRFAVRAGAWQTVRLPIPPLGPAHRLRLDPPGTSGTCSLRRLRWRERPLLAEPEWPAPGPPALPADAPGVQGGAITLRHAPAAWDSFALEVDGQPMARSHGRLGWAYLRDGRIRWVSPWEGSSRVRTRPGPGRLECRLETSDPDGGQWRWVRRFRPAGDGAGLAVETEVTVTAEREVVFLPGLALLPGAGSFGPGKTQGLLAGVEYLADEESSSERDLRGPPANRLVPARSRLTFPLAALAAGGRWLGLTWSAGPEVAVLHDSPDRTWGGGGHAWALLAPGSLPGQREEGRLLPYQGLTLRPGQAFRLRATLLGGRGGDVLPAVQAYVARRGLPPLPRLPGPLDDFFRLAAGAWLDGPIREGNRYRHAVGPGFAAGPAADAALYQRWLAGRLAGDPLAPRLQAAAAAAWAEVPADRPLEAQVGHLRPPAAALAGGAALAAVREARREAARLARAFPDDGRLRYVPPPGGPDLGATHWTHHANGLTSRSVLTLLELAVLAGDRVSLEAGLHRLRQLARDGRDVPRGAQTWEIPLHTPDLLASAHLTAAFTLGHELTGDPALLDAARYWAWTGVPFVFLESPGPGPVGVFSTTPVLGATHWVAPNWIGLPVQWCGLVYADALRQLAVHDPRGPWNTLARGLAVSAVQQTHPGPASRLGGLLPDSFDLPAQVRNPVPINPGTTLAVAIPVLAGDALQERRILRSRGWYLHAPGNLDAFREDRRGFSFSFRSSLPGPVEILISGVREAPEIRRGGRPEAAGAGWQWHPAEGAVVLRARGRETFRVAGGRPGAGR